MAISYLTQHIRTRPDEDDFSDEINGSSAGVSSANDENSTEEDRDITPEAEEKEKEDSDEVSSCNFLLPSLSFLCKQNSNLLMRI